MKKHVFPATLASITGISLPFTFLVYASGISTPMAACFGLLLGLFGLWMFGVGANLPPEKTSDRIAFACPVCAEKGEANPAYAKMIATSVGPGIEKCKRCGAVCDDSIRSTPEGLAFRAEADRTERFKALAREFNEARKSR